MAAGHPLARLQDRSADWHARMLGCRWDREPLELAREAGLEVVSAARTVLGIFHVIEARPR